MEYSDVNSKTISKVGYDDATSTLVIEFIANNSAYEYYDVPRYVFDEICACESAGKYANQNIYKVYRQQKIR